MRGGGCKQLIVVYSYGI